MQPRCDLHISLGLVPLLTEHVRHIRHVLEEKNFETLKTDSQTDRQTDERAEGKRERERQSKMASASHQ